jgi:hypothetical protein
MSAVMEQIVGLEDDLRQSGVVSGSWKHIHEFAMKVARVGHTIGWADAGVARSVILSGCSHRRQEDVAATRFPLPPKRVLREEPVPGASMDEILYRWDDGELLRRGPLSGGWERAGTVDAHRLDLMRHAIDLAKRPYREEPQ